MTLTQAKERLQFEEILASEAGQLNHGALPQWSREHKGRIAAKLLLRHGKTYARLQEMNCNGVGTWYNEDPQSFAKRQERFEKYLEHREQLLEKRIKAIVAELGPGFNVVFGGDPRGCTVKVVVPSGRTNDWGKEGICVPTA